MMPVMTANCVVVHRDAVAPARQAALVADDDRAVVAEDRPAGGRRCALAYEVCIIVVIVALERYGWCSGRR